MIEKYNKTINLKISSDKFSKNLISENSQKDFIAQILFTSGSTGSQSVVLTYKSRFIIFLEYLNQLN